MLLNHADQLTDVLTLVHELGHGTQCAFAQIQSQNSWEPGLALLEVPSTFAELLLVDHLTAAGVSDDVSLTLNAAVLDEVVGAVYRQTVFVRYEQRAYALRAEGVVLTPDRLGEIMSEEFGKLYGDTVVADLDDPTWTWARIPHFIDTRFYTYAYVFAFLVAFAAHARMRELPDFSDRYLRFLAFGGSASPADQLAELEIDLSDPGIWSAAFSEIERRVRGNGGADRSVGPLRGLVHVERPQRVRLLGVAEDLDVPGAAPAGLAQHTHQLRCARRPRRAARGRRARPRTSPRRGRR